MNMSERSNEELAEWIEPKHGYTFHESYICNTEEDTIEARREIALRLRATKVKVKALEWVEYKTAYMWRSERYVVTSEFGFWRAMFSHELIPPGYFNELDDAKAACQAHHTQHVLSMIEIDTPTNQGKQP
ncbi:MAG: hypothetical protein IPI29_08515 [Ignavibacteria bacterium]|nr:hypothetical protein [Ignavibacteria bacterium]